MGCNILREYYYIQRTEEVLIKVIDLQEKWLALCPLGHKNHTAALEDLEIVLQKQYQEHGNVADLNRAIELEKKYLSFVQQVIHSMQSCWKPLRITNYMLSQAR